MDAPTMFPARRVAPDVTCLPSYFARPRYAADQRLRIHAAEPVLVDTGLQALRTPFLEALASAIDPADLHWIWLSHMDADHLGNLEAVLALAPKARVVTNFLGMGKLILRELDLSRVHMLAPGAAIDAGDRTLIPVRPAFYDAPETIGFLDARMRVLFSADAFGALMQEPQEEAAAIAPAALRDGMITWTAVDAPWLGLADRTAFGRVLKSIERLDPTAIISGHLPVCAALRPPCSAISTARSQPARSQRPITMRSSG